MTDDERNIPVPLKPTSYDGPYTVEEDTMEIWLTSSPTPIASVFPDLLDDERSPEARATAYLLAASWEMRKALRVAESYCESVLHEHGIPNPKTQAMLMVIRHALLMAEPPL